MAVINGDEKLCANCTFLITTNGTVHTCHYNPPVAVVYIPKEFILESVHKVLTNTDLTAAYPIIFDPEDTDLAWCNFYDKKD